MPTRRGSVVGPIRRRCRPRPGSTSPRINPNKLNTRVPLDLTDTGQQQCEGAVGVSGVVPEGLGDVGGPGQAEQADGQVPQGGHHLWAVAGANLAEVFTEGHVADPVQPILYAPMAAEPGRELVGAGLVGGQVGDGVDGFGAPL